MVAGIEPNDGRTLYPTNDIRTAIRDKFQFDPAVITCTGNRDLFYEVQMCVDPSGTNAIKCPNGRPYISNCKDYVVFAIF